jgi:hypothetical protein
VIVADLWYRDHDVARSVGVRVIVHDGSAPRVVALEAG